MATKMADCVSDLEETEDCNASLPEHLKSETVQGPRAYLSVVDGGQCRVSTQPVVPVHFLPRGDTVQSTAGNHKDVSRCCALPVREEGDVYQSGSCVRVGGCDDSQDSCRTVKCKEERDGCEPSCPTTAVSQNRDHSECRGYTMEEESGSQDNSAALCDDVLLSAESGCSKTVTGCETESSAMKTDTGIVVKLEPHTDSEEDCQSISMTPFDCNGYLHSNSSNKNFPVGVPVALAGSIRACELCNDSIESSVDRGVSRHDVVPVQLYKNENNISKEESGPPGLELDAVTGLNNNYSGKKNRAWTQRQKVVEGSALSVSVSDKVKRVPGVFKRHMPASDQPQQKQQDRCENHGDDQTEMIPHTIRQIRVRRAQQRFTCEECGMVFRWQSRFDEHKRRHTGEQPFICHECGDAFTSSSYLRIHERKHRGQNPYPCTICGEEFMQGRHLSEHRKSHAEEGDFACKICGVKCANPGMLNRHIQTQHPEDKSNRPFACQICPAAFQRSYHLETHMRSHTGEKPFTCTICLQSYSTQGSLKVHIRSHTGERPFQCKVCGRGFITSGQLKKHTRTHSKAVFTVSHDNQTVVVRTPKSSESAPTEAERRRKGREVEEKTAPLKEEVNSNPEVNSNLEMNSYPKVKSYPLVDNCPVEAAYPFADCDSDFVGSCTLAARRRHHHPQPTTKDKVCQECGVSFLRAHALKVHQRSHSGVKPFRCDKCDKEFTQRSNLTAHQRTHTHSTKLTPALLAR